MNFDPKDILEKTLICAKQAGELLAQAQASPQINFQDARDVKLQADEDSEALLRELLPAVLDLPVVGEELGGDTQLPLGEDLYWVVDPLDGTYNYLRGNALCCVSIGLMRGLEPVLGVVYDFTYDLAYTGAVGEGFWINGKAHTPQWQDEPEHGALMTGFPSSCEQTDTRLMAFFEQIRTYKKIRMCGSAALALATVAAGQADAYFEPSTNLWDSAGGIALVRAAGGYIDVRLCEPGKTFLCDTFAGPSQAWRSQTEGATR